MLLSALAKRASGGSGSNWSSVTTTGTGSSCKYQATATLPSTSTQTIQEAGLFSASTSGVMFVHAAFTGIALSSGDSIAFTLTIDPS